MNTKSQIHRLVQSDFCCGSLNQLCPPTSSETGVQDRAGDPEPDQGEGDPCDGAEEEAGQPPGDTPVCSLCKNPWGGGWSRWRMMALLLFPHQTSEPVCVSELR